MSQLHNLTVDQLRQAVAIKEQIEKLQDELDSIVGARDALVNFMETKGVDLRAHGIDRAQAAKLRGRLKTFAADWERPEADIYDQDPAR
jgi:hypothetical protein